MSHAARPLFERGITLRAIGAAFGKLNPLHLLRNPVMFVVEVGSLLTTVLALLAFAGRLAEPPGFILAVSLWLWLTVLFANFAEAMAEGRGKAQADNLRNARRDVTAKKLAGPWQKGTAVRRRQVGMAALQGAVTLTPAGALRKNDVVLVEAGDIIPGDGEVIEGVASVDESAI